MRVRQNLPPPFPVRGLRECHYCYVLLLVDNFNSIPQLHQFIPHIQAHTSKICSMGEGEISGTQGPPNNLLKFLVFWPLLFVGANIH